MARYRQVHTEFWQDGFVLDLTPEEKYFYIYLMTNSKTTQCGIYELPKRIIETETGYNRETVEKLLQRFVDYGKIEYDEKTREIMMINWIKYNWINSPKVISLINKELKEIKNIGFVYHFITLCKEYEYRMDTLWIPDSYSMEQGNEESLNSNGSIPYKYPIDTVGIDLGEEQEREREREQEREVEREQEQEGERKIVNDDVRDVIQFWDKNGFGINNMNAKNELLSWLDNSSFKNPKEMILKALDISSKNDARRFSYVEGILKNWTNENLLTIEEVEKNDNRIQGRRSSNTSGFGKGTSYEQAQRELEAAERSFNR